MASRKDRKSTRLNSSHLVISYAVFCLKKKNSMLHPFLLFFFNDTATTEIYTLSLHDALPILWNFLARELNAPFTPVPLRAIGRMDDLQTFNVLIIPDGNGGRMRRELGDDGVAKRSEEHTSELQSPCNLVCRLLLEKKK